MTRAVPFAQLLRAAGELAAQGEDADTIAASLRNSHRHATLADTTRAAEGIFPRSDDPEAMKSALIAKYPGIKFKVTP